MFFVTDNYVSLVITALVVTINVTGSEVGEFLSLEQALLLSAPFVFGGVLKIVYDVGMFFSFRKIKPPEEL